MAETIPLRFAQSLLRLVPMPEEQLRRELNELNLPLVMLQDRGAADARVPVEDYGRLFIHLVRKLQGQMAAPGSDPEGTLLFSAYRMMFQAMLHSGKLETALQRSSAYFRRLQARGQSFHIDKQGDSASLRFDFQPDDDRPLSSPDIFDMEQLNWLPGLTGQLLSIAMWHRVCGWFIGSFIELEAVEMQQPPREDREYPEVFGTPVRFNAERDAIHFHRRYLDFPIVQSEDSLARMLSTYPAELFSISPQNHGVVNRVKQLIGTDFQRPLPSLQDVAERLHMTTPTLHRRLRDEGTSFQQLKDRCRRDAAVGYLMGGDHTTARLAELMGFSDSSTFHRAFKKWTGLTPQEYRQQHC